MSNSEFNALFPDWLTQSLSLPPYFWNINGYSADDGMIEFRGWALPWYGYPFNRTLRREGGTGVEVVTTVDKGFAMHFPYWPNAPTAPFAARSELGVTTLDYISIESSPAIAAAPLSHPLNQFSRWLFVPTTKDFLVPPPDIIAHIGESSADYYLVSGCTLFNGFKSAFERYAGRPLLSAVRILDWGCGPGRIGLHLTKAIAQDSAATEYVGVDIDPLSLTWAEHSLPGTFICTGRLPPLPFPDGHFDFIFGYSVFTHLDRPIQLAWMAELRRVCASGGIVAVTVMAELALFYFEPFLRDEEARARFVDGIYANMPNTQLEESGIGGDYYRNVWMSRDFILDNWTEHFEILAVHPNFHHYQDLVVLRAL
ncbi:MAG: class I SAM-dependent methyltransferase [Acetobacteraceae bacterium]